MKKLKKAFNAIAKQIYFNDVADIKEGDRRAAVETKSFLRIFQSVSGKLEEGQWPPAPGKTYSLSYPRSARLSIKSVKAADEARTLFQTGHL